MEKRKQASRTPNASRNTTARSMSERQGVRGLLNLAAAFGVREACFRFGLSHQHALWNRQDCKGEKLFLFQVQCQWAGRSPVSARSKIEMLPYARPRRVGSSVCPMGPPGSVHALSRLQRLGLLSSSDETGC